LQKYLQNILHTNYFLHDIFSDEIITRIKHSHTNYILHTNYFLHDIFSDEKVTRIIIAKILAEYFHIQIIFCILIISCIIFGSISKNTCIKHSHTNYILHDIFSDKKVTRLIFGSIRKNTCIKYSHINYNLHTNYFLHNIWECLQNHSHKIFQHKL
jgi:hypothetical protein